MKKMANLVPRCHRDPQIVNKERSADTLPRANQAAPWLFHPPDFSQQHHSMVVVLQPACNAALMPEQQNAAKCWCGCIAL